MKIKKMKKTMTDDNYKCYFCGKTPICLENELDMIPIDINGKSKYCCRECVKKLNKIYYESEESCL